MAQARVAQTRRLQQVVREVDRPGGDPADDRVSQTDRLLHSKTRVPRPGPDALERVALTRSLDEAVGGRLVLVSAPAGFGKTTAIAQWAAQASTAVAWLSLDEDDDDPERFLRYLGAALSTIDQQFGLRLQECLNEADRKSPAALAVDFLDLTKDLPPDLVIVLDDLHVLRSSEVRDILVQLVEHLPPRVHLIIASRVDPTLPLSRLRARGQLTEIRADDLRFDHADAMSFFTDVWRLSIPEDAARVISRRTEGWVAGLQLAALALRKRDNVEAFAREFAGSHRFVLDFLTEEVLDRQPEDVREFLLATSVLTRMDPSLAEAVSDRSDSGEILAWLERSNLFVVSLDDERSWYRYHHLFADVLRARLRRLSPAREVELHRTAARWCGERGLIDDAIRHWLAAREPRRAAMLIERHIEEVLLRRSDRATIGRWLKALPSDVVLSRSRLVLARAISALIEGSPEEVTYLLKAAEVACEASGDDDDTFEPTVGRRASVLANVDALIAIIRADVARLRGDPDVEEARAREALDLVSGEDKTLASIARYHLGVSHWVSGRLEEAEHDLSAVITERLSRAENYLAIRASYDLIQLQVAAGELRTAERTCRAADDMVRETEGVSPRGIVLAARSEVHRQRWQLEASVDSATQAAALCRRLAYRPPLIRALVTLGWARESLGDEAAADEAFDEALAAARSNELASLYNPAPAEFARLMLKRGRLDAAAVWAQERGIEDGDVVPYPRELDHLVFAKVLLALGTPDRALPLIEKIEASAASAGRLGSLVHARVVRALVLDALKGREEALSSLAPTVSMAGQCGLISPFADEGPAMGALLRDLVVSHRRRALPGIDDLAPGYVARLIKACDPDHGSTPQVMSANALRLGVVEQLSPREHEVLTLLAVGRTNPEIARQLFVTVDTVKKHVSHICQKLVASNRTEAVAHARELALLG